MAHRPNPLGSRAKNSYSFLKHVLKSATETIWLVKPKIFTILPFREKGCDDPIYIILHN